MKHIFGWATKENKHSNVAPESSPSSKTCLEKAAATRNVHHSAAAAGHPPTCGVSEFLEDPETLIFVDADGVVNVGIRDCPDQSPLLLSEENLARLEASMAAVPSGGKPLPSATIFDAAARRQIGHGDEGTYSKFATRSGSSDICPIFAERMADIIIHGGSRCIPVLSSSWRKSNHRDRVAALEAQLSRFGGREIVFKAHTKPGADTPGKRVELIGDFVQEYSSKRRACDSPLRVVLLEDFSASHPRAWSSKELIRSTKDVEDYLCNRSCQPALTKVKLVHTYDEWTTDLGLHVQIGTGLTCAKVDEAKRFFLDMPP
jgi:hypothetical protein